ncbi:hypothetical protein PtoMrB4_28650 [Metapseudomonas otitidis]|uniref:Uncharacterized protein n=1 Tax=Metapseudomonas otitidis TaxID=319939 RepID=A0A679GKK1_9GAMM|nr:hypothetical protein PtoMrB4_28650 [Pseudomonas otitidis]
MADFRIPSVSRRAAGQRIQRGRHTSGWVGWEKAYLCCGFAINVASEGVFARRAPSPVQEREGPHQGGALYVWEGLKAAPGEGFAASAGRGCGRASKAFGYGCTAP